MGRPFALVGLTCLLTLAAAVFFGAAYSLPLACICLAGFGVSVFLPRLQKTGVFPVVLCTMALAFGAFSAFTESFESMAASLDGRDAVAELTFCELPERSYGRFYYTAELDSVEGVELNGTPKVRISSRVDLAVAPYDRFRIRLRFYRPDGGDGFSSRAYNASRGIVACAAMNGEERMELLPPRAKPPYYYALLLRSELIRTVNVLFPAEEAALVRGMLLADKSGISAETREQFRTIGLSHLLAVSGLHMTTVAGLLLLLLKKLRLPRAAVSLCTAAGILGFMALTGFVPSATRSGVMCLILLLGRAVSQRADTLNSLGFAALLLGLANPCSAADTGLLLSFSATLGLVLASGPVCRALDAHMPGGKRTKKVLHSVNSVIAASLCATIFTLPVMLLSFRSVSLVFLPANVLTLFPATWMLQLSAAAAVLGLAFPGIPFAAPFAWAADILARWLLWCAGCLSQIPYASVSTSYGFVPLWLACVLFLAGTVFLFRGGHRLYAAVGALSIFLLCVGLLSFQIASRDVTRVAVLDVGGGNSVAVTRNGRTAVFGCGGNAGIVQSYLRGKNIREIACFVPLSVSGTEGKNAARLVKEYSVDKTVAMASTEMDEYFYRFSHGNPDCILYETSAVIQVWDGLRVEARGKDLLLHVEGINVLLHAGKGTQDGLPAEWLNADFVILGGMPKEPVLLHPFYTILAMPEEEARSLSVPPDYALCTDSGTVVLEIEPSGRLKIRRES